jgi:DNA-binding protein YbaB
MWVILICVLVTVMATGNLVLIRLGIEEALRKREETLEQLAKAEVIVARQRMRLKQLSEGVM